MGELRTTQDLSPRKTLGDAIDKFFKKDEKNGKGDKEKEEPPNEKEGKLKIPILPSLIGKDPPEKTTTSIIDPSSPPTLPSPPTATEAPPKTTTTTPISIATSTTSTASTTSTTGTTSTTSVANTASTTSTTSVFTPPPLNLPTPDVTPTEPLAVSSPPVSSSSLDSSTSSDPLVATSTVGSTSSSSASVTPLSLIPGTRFSTITTSSGLAITGTAPDISAPATTSSSAATLDSQAKMLSSGQTVGVVIGSISSFFLVVALAVFACRRWTRHHHQDLAKLEPGDSDTLSRGGYSRMEDPVAVPDVEAARGLFALSSQLPEVAMPKPVFSKWFSQMRQAIPISFIRPFATASREAERVPQHPGTGCRRTPVSSMVSTMFNRQGSSPSAGRSTPSTFSGRPPGTPFRQSGVSEISSMWAATVAMRDTDSGTFVPTTPLRYPRGAPSGLYQEVMEPPLPRIPPELEAGSSRRIRISIPEALPKSVKARESVISSDSRDENSRFASDRNLRL
ncbi:hypothetical protein B0H67DRAFT_235758 [Lasiosphaeris hirsuta]|uniref:Uncharacterized protein n=1 Tax=Lasiosphaeris hirsuta TaxID=260670 RepID=A0AA40DTQ7_9PEZI|nr:hypothetical protein B0H67DRAFT_235758 [Lasiosphaeris hirsuta]